jgi:hypothetical protein
MVNPLIAIGQIFLIVASLSATIIGFINRNKFRELRFIYFYPFASFLETTISPVIIFEYPKLNNDGLPKIFVSIFIVIEIFLIYQFYFQIVELRKIKKLLLIIFIIYIATMGFIGFNKHIFSRHPDIFFVPQAICIIIPAICYLVNTAKQPVLFELGNKPSFWVIAGLLLYFGCTLPLFLVYKIVLRLSGSELDIYFINYFSYGLLFILISKAYLCKKKEVR